MAKCVILGSANGIENVGDVLLLHCAMRNINSAYPEITEFTVQVDGDVAVAAALTERWEPAEFRVDKNYSVEWSASPWQSIWVNRRLRGFGRVPEFLYFPVLVFLYYIYYLFGGLRNQAWLQAWRRSDLVYFYGGSHFSKSFFWANGFPMLLLALIADHERTRLVFGPQQFGPQTGLQQRLSRLIFRQIGGRVFFRNRECAEMFGLQSRLTFDEVFVSDLYRSAGVAPPAADLGLINFRGSDFERETGDRVDQFVNLLRADYLQRCRKWRVFSMSTPKFNNDLVLADLFPVLDGQAAGRIDSDLLSKDLKGASLCLAMSYHGCMLAIFHGVAAIPIVSGDYYAWKFSDFDRYCGHRERIRWTGGGDWSVERPDSAGLPRGEELCSIRQRAIAHHFALFKSIVGQIG